jgi:hypothetical protein
MQRPEKFACADADNGLNTGSHPTSMVGDFRGACCFPIVVGTLKRSLLWMRITDWTTGPWSIAGKALTAKPSPTGGAIKSIASTTRMLAPKYAAKLRIDPLHDLFTPTQ